jgi:tetratricopeptide (TPR) repeat protein
MQPQNPRIAASNTAGSNAAGSAERVQHLFQLGTQLFSWKLFPEATDLFRYLTSRLPTETWTWFWLGRCSEELGDLVAAAGHYQTAGNLGSPSTFAALAGRAWLRAGHPERALLALRNGGLLQ